MTQKTLSRFLLAALSCRGVKHIFGVPGDYILDLVYALGEQSEIANITTRTEAGSAFAANIYGRIKGLGACYGSYNVGCLNMLSAVTDAKTNFCPLVVIGSEIALNKRSETHCLFHHQTRMGYFDDQRDNFVNLLGPERTISLVDHRRAWRQIISMIDMAMRDKQPVYIGVPQDMWNRLIETPRYLPSPPAKTLTWLPESKFQNLLQRTMSLLDDAARPVILIGHLAQRFGLTESIARFSQKARIPVISSFNGRGDFPLTHPLFTGAYVGTASYPEIAGVMAETSDCLMEIGVYNYEVNHGLREPKLPRPSLKIDLPERAIVIGNHYATISAKDAVHFINLLTENVLPRDDEKVESFADYTEKETKNYQKTLVRASDAVPMPIKTADIAPILNAFFSKNTDMPLIADTGDAMMIALQVLSPAGYFTSSNYGTMGISVGAFGVEFAGKRPVVLVGDGAFSMWEGELGSFKKYGLCPIIIVLNNNGWGMLRHKNQNAESLTLAPIHFHRLAKAIDYGRGFLVLTPNGFAEALHQAAESKTLAIINVRLEPDDQSLPMRKLIE